MIALDTTAIIDLFKGQELIKSKLENVKFHLCSTDFTYLELMFGLNNSLKKHQDEEYYYDEFFKTINMYRLNEVACKKAAQIFHELKKKGKEISKTDCTIAAILLCNGVNTIITNNSKHFKRIPGLKVIEY